MTFKKNTQHKNIKGGKNLKQLPGRVIKKDQRHAGLKESANLGDVMVWKWIVFSGCFFFYLQVFFGVWCCDILEVGKSDLLCKVTTTKSDISDTSVVWKKMESWKLGKLWGIWRNVKGRGSFLGRRCEDVRMWGLGWRSREYTESRIDRNRLNRRRYSKVILWPFYQGKSNLLIEIRMKRGNLFLKLQTIHFI